MKKELFKFMVFLWNCGLIDKSENEIDYEKIIWRYLKINEKENEQ